MAREKLETLYAGKHLTLVATGNWEFVTRMTKNPAVAIVAITNDDRVVLVEQFRIPAGQRVIEIPAGLSGDTPGTEGEPLLESAKRELLEETGYEASRWTELGRGYSSPGLSDELIAVFLAEDLAKLESGGGDSQEKITIHEVPIRELLPWLDQRGATMDLKMLAGVFAAQHHRATRK
jgi:ADP-ribose pyrophosphatase